jgi:AAA domain/CHC2 zinc finger
MDVADAKIALPFPALLNRLGIPAPDRDRFKLKCPIHREERGESFSVERKNGRESVLWCWYCFGKCNRGGDEITFLQAFESLSREDAVKRYLSLAGGRNAAAELPAAPRRARPEQEATPTIEFDWDKYVSPLTSNRLAEERGYAHEFVAELQANKLLGIFDGYLALPLHRNGKIVGAHFKIKNRWQYFPKGMKAAPLVIGELTPGDPVHVFESQWDGFSYMNLSGERSGIIITRGASNGGLVAGLIPAGSTVYLWTQNDEAGEKWQKDICANTSATVKWVKIPAPHKDLNDWMRAGATTDDLLMAMVNAEVLCALPAIQDAAALLAQPIELPPDVLDGILHRGGKMVAAGASKTFKTWFLIDLAASVATGAEWFNGYPTKKGAVLFANFELPEPFFWHRVRTVCDERQLTIEPGMLHVWNLRGHILEWEKLQQQIQSGTYVLIILDPIYKLLLGRDENRAADIASLLNELEVLAVRSGAAVAFGAHYSKGNQAQKESIDRIGGSGVFGRDPDTILNFTRHEEEDCFTVEMTLRNHPPQNPFVVRWEYPVFIVDSLLDPNRLKQAGGRPRLATETQILDLLDEKPLKAVEWQRRAREEFGIASSTFYAMKRDLQERGFIQSIAGVFSKI